MKKSRINPAGVEAISSYSQAIRLTSHRAHDFRRRTGGARC